MPEFYSSKQLPSSILTTFSPEAIGIDLLGMRCVWWGSTGSGTWPVANLALFIPFSLSEEVVVTRIYHQNGAAVNGNLDIGIYSRNYVRQVSAGPTAQAGAFALQFVDVADTTLGPGLYYIAVVIDNVVGTTSGWSVWANIVPAVAGMFQMANAYPLPNPAVPTQITGTLIPTCGMTFYPRAW
jgi:hypothetical protein